MPHHDELHPDLKRLLDDAIDFACSAKKTTDFRFPFVLTATSSGKEHRVVVVADADDIARAGLEEARRRIACAPLEVLRYVIAYDGLLFSTTGKELPAFMFEAGQRDQDFAFVCYQRYRAEANTELVLIVDERGGFLRKEPNTLGSRPPEPRKPWWKRILG